MTDMEQRAAAREFAAYWQNHGDEKQETSLFWLTLLQKVLGAQDADKLIAFEVPVKLGHVSFIDAFIAENRVLIEQKGSEIDLRKGYRQSDGSMLTPFQQARRYAGYLPHDQNPRWIVVCNFREFHIHDMNRPNDTPDVILLSELEHEYHRLAFLAKRTDATLQREMELSIQAGELVGSSTTRSKNATSTPKTPPPSKASTSCACGWCSACTPRTRAFLAGATCSMIISGPRA